MSNPTVNPPDGGAPISDRQWPIDLARSVSLPQASASRPAAAEVSTMDSAVAVQTTELELPADEQPADTPEPAEDLEAEESEAEEPEAEEPEAEPAPAEPAPSWSRRLRRFGPVVSSRPVLAGVAGVVALALVLVPLLVTGGGSGSTSTASGDGADGLSYGEVSATATVEPGMSVLPPAPVTEPAATSAVEPVVAQQGAPAGTQGPAAGQPSGSRPAGGGTPPTQNRPPAGGGGGGGGAPAPGNPTGNPPGNYPVPPPVDVPKDPPPAAAPVSFAAVTGDSCQHDSNRGFKKIGAYSKGEEGWYGRGSGGHSGDGCGGSFTAVPMSGHANNDDPTASVLWWFRTGAVTSGNCAVAVFVPRGQEDKDVAAKRAYYTVERGQNNSSVINSFSINHATNQGRWIAAGTFPVSGGEIAVRLRTRGEDPKKEHLGASAVRVDCRA